MNSISIANVELTVDAEGRYNLNALHRASGGEKKDGPSYWLATEKAKELIVELSTTGFPVVAQIQPVNTIVGGNAPGTFAVEQVIVAYANWISPAFYLKVINTFLEAQRKMTPAQRLLQQAKALVVLEEKQWELEREQARVAKESAETKAQVVALVNGEDYFTIVGYTNLIGRKMPLDESQRLGKEASAVCRENGWETGHAPHPQYGSVKTYPREALEKIFH